MVPLLELTWRNLIMLMTYGAWGIKRRLKWNLRLQVATGLRQHAFHRLAHVVRMVECGQQHH